MSRLIDADMLSPDRDYYYNGGYDAVSCQQIDYAPTVKAIPLNRIKKAREEIQKLRGCSCSCSDGIIDDVEDILDELIESEE
jgi:hypothetical protein